MRFKLRAPIRVAMQGRLAASGDVEVAQRPSFTTDFPDDEAPLSQNGRFVRSTADLDQWEPMVSSGGLCYGTNGPDNDYDDAFARIDGTVGDYTVSFVVARTPGLNTGVTHEIEILRIVENPDGSVTAIEILFHFSGFCQCFLWDHPPEGAQANTFTEVSSSGGSPSGGFEDGDLCRLVFAGTTATCQQWNGSSWSTIAIYTHARLALYELGIGYFTRPGGDPADYCMTQLTVTPT